MNNETNQQKKSRPKSFYTALLISLAMIAAACAYAYQATTADTLDSLESLQNDLTAETEPSTEATTTVTENAPYNAAAGIRPETFEEEVTVPATEAPTDASAPETEHETEAAPTPSLDHVVVMPIEGEVIQEFSAGELVKSETTGTWQTHNGVDIGAEEGTPVAAMDNGTVSDVTKDALWGICVTIDHGNGIVSRYCGLSPSLSVQSGEAVESGQTIGAVGNSADIESKQPSHVHIEVLKNDIYVDPIAFIAEE